MKTLNLTETQASPLFATKPIDGVSKQYGFVDTQEIIRVCVSQGFELNRTRIARARQDRQGFQKHALYFRHPSLKIGDDFVEVVVINSHDRSSAVQFHLGIFRLVCENGLVSGNNFFNAKVYHTGKALQVQVIEALNSALETAPQVQTLVNRMHNVLLPYNTELQYASRIAKHLQDFYNDGRIIDVNSLLQVERSEDSSSTLWTVFNRVQEHALRGGYKYISQRINPLTGQLEQARSMKARSIKAIQTDIKLNKMLFDVTQVFLEEIGA